MCSVIAASLFLPQFERICRFPSSLRPILGTVSVSKDELFTEEQVYGALQQYAEAFNLTQENSTSLKLDRLMVGNLFNKKDPVVEGNPHSLQDLQRRLLGKLQQYHRASRISEQVSLPFSAKYAEIDRRPSCR